MVAVARWIVAALVVLLTMALTVRVALSDTPTILRIAGTTYPIAVVGVVVWSARRARRAGEGAWRSSEAPLAVILLSVMYLVLGLAPAGAL